MRKEPFVVGDYVHVFNRGNRKMDIARDDNDFWRLLTALRFYNDTQPAQYLLQNFFAARKSNLVRSNLTNQNPFDWPAVAEIQTPLVSMIAYCFLSNHYHLLMKEIVPGGITEFMRKIGTGYTLFTNKKYGETGKVFQGSYRARVISGERYLQYLDAYIQILNPLERIIPAKRLTKSKVNIDAVLDDQFSSLGESLGYRDFSILDRKETEEKFQLPTTKKKYLEFMESVVAEGGLTKLLGKLSIDQSIELESSEV